MWSDLQLCVIETYHTEVAEFKVLQWRRQNPQARVVQVDISDFPPRFNNGYTRALIYYQYRIPKEEPTDAKQDL